MSEITSELLEVTVDTDATVEIDSTLPEAQVDITKSITAEIQPENYVLTAGGIYTGNLTGQIPTWILDAVNQQLTTGDGNITSVLNDMQILLDDLQLGVNQAISQIENTNTSLSALETSLSSQIGANSADILDVYATRVTATEAQAIATTAIGTTFNNNVDAYIGNLASVYTAPGSATATNISTLQTSYNDQTARIDGIEYATTDEFGYSLGASKLGTAPDGSITGWQFTDGTGVQSEFKIQAEKFSVSDGTTGYTPFLIDGTDIKFNGLVEFTGLGIDSNSTTIDGGRIATGKIQSANGNTYFDLANNQIKMNNGSFILDSTAAGTSAAPNIQGGYIKSSYLETMYTVVPGTTNYGKFVHSTPSTSSVTITMPFYGSGYRADRVTSITSSSLVIIGKRSYNTGSVRNGTSITSLLTQSINGAIATTIESKTSTITIPDITVTVFVTVFVSVYTSNGGWGQGEGRGSGFGTGYPYVTMIGTHDFMYVVNLSLYPTNAYISFSVPDGTVSMILSNT